MWCWGMLILIDDGTSEGRCCHLQMLLSPCISLGDLRGPVKERGCGDKDISAVRRRAGCESEDICSLTQKLSQSTEYYVFLGEPNAND